MPVGAKQMIEKSVGVIKILAPKDTFNEDYSDNLG